MRYPNFDVLRLLLAVQVAFVHGWAYTDTKFNWAGYIMAVPAFLAISGFLVLKSYEESGSVTLFMRKRALRLLPALAVSILLCFVLFNWQVAWDSFIIWLTGGLISRGDISNSPLWSLAWEELAYFVLIVLWGIGAYRRKIAIWILFFSSLLIVDWALKFSSHTQIIVQLMLAFFIGNLAYLYRTDLLKVHPTVSWLILAMVVFKTEIPFIHRLVDVSPVTFQSFAVVLVGIAGFRSVPFRFPDISYGIYIFHMPIIIYLIRNNIATTTQSMLIWLPLLLIPTCLLSWYAIEKPALRFKIRPGK